jgi:WD40 repeat protein
MENKLSHFLFSLVAAALLWTLGACAGNGTRPPSNTPAGQVTTNSALGTLFTDVPSPTMTATFTRSMTSTETATPTEYQLLDWREPTEVITSENMQQVERIGRLQIMSKIIRISWSPDGSKFGVSSADRGTFIFDSMTYNELFQVAGCCILAFSYDGKVLETGGFDYNIQTGEPIDHGHGPGGGSISAFPGYFTDIVFSPDGEYLVAAGTENNIIEYLKKQIPGMSFSRGSSETSRVSISPDSKIVAINYEFENFMELFDPYKLNSIRLLKLKEITAQGKPRFSSDGKSLFFTGRGIWKESESSFLQEWDYANGQPLDIQILPKLVYDAGFSMDLSIVSKLLVFGTMDGDVFLLKNRDCHAVKIGTAENSSYIDQVAFRADGKIFATIEHNNQGIIDLWGIPAIGKSTGNDTPVPTVEGIPSPCLKIPMVVEHPKPEIDWKVS